MARDYLASLFFGVLAALFILLVYHFFQPASIAPSQFHIGSESDLLAFVSILIGHFTLLITILGIIVSVITIFFALRLWASEREFQTLKDQIDNQLKEISSGYDKNIADNAAADRDRAKRFEERFAEIKSLYRPADELKGDILKEVQLELYRKIADGALTRHEMKSLAGCSDGASQGS